VIIVFFIDGKGRGLLQLKSCLKQLEEQLDTLSIHYQPHKQVTRPNEIFLGNDMLAYFTNQRIEHTQGNTYDSTTEMLDKLSQPIFTTDIPVEDYHFYFEDLSPDACLSFILIYCQYHGVSTSQFPKEWIDYTIRWELGDVKTTGKPFESWGCLHSALAHAYFIMEEKIDEHGNVTPVIDQDNVLEGLRACLWLTIALLLEEVAPYEVPYLDHIEEFNRAYMYLKMEHQKYLLGLKYATITQLELPVINANRKLMVDAFITTENTYMGLLKSFLMHDEERTWLESGFQFFAIYRPDFKGTGRDMVIQVDPQLYVHLNDLKQRLEAMERERAVSEEENISWSHPTEQLTTLTAPKRAGGSRLQWSEIVRIIWELYNPANSITVHPFRSDGTIADACRIYECKPVLAKSKLLRIVKWNSLGQQQVLVSSPTLQRYIAACAANLDHTQVPPIHPLPTKGSFDFIELPCGYAFIHNKGIFILDDWNNEPVDFPLYKQEVEHLIERVETFGEIHRACVTMMSDIKKQLQQSQTFTTEKLQEINHWITMKKTEIRHTILKTMLSSSDYYLQMFRKTIEKRWAIDTQLSDLYDTLSELEQILENHMNLRTNRLITIITIFGFPFVLFSGLFEVIFGNLPSSLWLGINWTAVVVFFVLSLVGTLAISRYMKISLNFLRRKRKDA
jgi:hypothetical protein